MIRIGLEDFPIAGAIGSVRRAETSVRRSLKITSRQQQTQRTLLD
jgi:hypothetical protein